ncbi:hypothetical protein KFU94_17920 [Chloroflexi bacterium TSY]|nr:hypothetical protein [Chloroflexi bacterium TSY]
MIEQLQLLITFGIYLLFFGWIGYQRGALRAGVVFLVAMLSWVLLQEQGGIFVSIANLGGKFTTFLQAGGLSGDPEGAFAALRDAPNVMTEEFAPAYLFILWIVVLLAAYFITSNFIPDDASPKNGWAIMFGLFNGILFGSVLLPRMLRVIAPESVILPDMVEGTTPLRMLHAFWGAIVDNIKTVDLVLDQRAPLAWMMLLTLFLLLVLSSLRT